MAGSRVHLGSHSAGAQRRRVAVRPRRTAMAPVHRGVGVAESRARRRGREVQANVHRQDGGSLMATKRFGPVKDGIGTYTLANGDVRYCVVYRKDDKVHRVVGFTTKEAARNKQ